MVRKVGNGWVVFSEDGRRLSKPFSSQAEAEKRLKQIEMFKALAKKRGAK